MANVSKIDIINMALLLVGAEKIHAITDATKAARLAGSVYNVSVNEVFEIPIKWKFATARAELSAYSINPISGYAYQYELPSGYVRMVALIDEDGDSVEYAWTRELFVASDGSLEDEFDMLLTNETKVFIKYIRTRENVSKWPASFVRLVYLSIAILISEPLKQKSGQVRQLVKMFEAAYTTAKISNAMDDVDVNSNGVRLDDGNQDVIDVIFNADLDKRYIVRDS